LSAILKLQSPDCQATVSALYSGRELVAAHFGLRSRRTLHYWLPAYNPCFAKYSPGIILLLKLAEAASDLGIKVIDLGRGDADYKRRLMNGSVGVAEGSVEAVRLVSLVRRMRKTVGQWVRERPLVYHLLQSIRGR
jgi:CelD/BcsL family acetyltransferase involved in cellulose biosynthesis